jgi:hypothetical protein
VRKHGARQFNILPNLRELADNTAPAAIAGAGSKETP